jgi:hypothetical protein
MSPAAILALLQVIDGLITQAPEALSLWATVKAMLTGNTDPTADQWTQLVGQMAAAHAAVQGTTTSP